MHGLLPAGSVAIRPNRPTKAAPAGVRLRFDRRAPERENGSRRRDQSRTIPPARGARPDRKAARAARVPSGKLARSASRQSGRGPNADAGASPVEPDLGTRDACNPFGLVASTIDSSLPGGHQKSLPRLPYRLLIWVSSVGGFGWARVTKSGAGRPKTGLAVSSPAGSGAGRPKTGLRRTLLRAVSRQPSGAARSRA
jgi:hypothetical protein